jgi:DNA-binding NtrC family response regulator
MADSPLIKPSDLHGIENQGASMLVRNRSAGMAMGTIASTEAGNGSDDLLQDPLIREDGHIRRLLEIEADAIAKALTIYRGRMSETARRLGIGRSTLYRKIDELQIDKRDM